MLTKLPSYFDILPLAKNPEWLNPLVEQQWQEWGYDDAKDLEDFYSQTFELAMPKTWLLLDTSKQVMTLVGAVTLSIDEMGNAQPTARNPWLGYLYIEPNYRGQGLAKWLTHFAVEQARILGYNEVFLYASDEMPRYLKWGWQPIETLNFQDEDVTVMTLSTKT